MLRTVAVMVASLAFAGVVVQARWMVYLSAGVPVGCRRDIDA